MELLLVSGMEDPSDWVEELTCHRADLTVRVWPDVGSRADVTYALVWRPPAEALADLPNLKAIFSLGAGVDGIFETATDLPPGVPVVRMVEQGLSQGMREYVAWQVLDWHRYGPDYRAAQRAAQWHRGRAIRLASERRVGVLGLGVLGQAVATTLVGLGFQVAGWSRSAKEVEGVESIHGPDGLARIVALSDIVVNLLPLTPDTEGLIDARFLAAMKPGAVLVNAGRGRHVVEADLLAALDSGNLGGVSLDVFATEPLPPDHPFWQHPKISMTPHMAAVTLPRTAAPAIAAQIARIESGEPPLHVVDTTRGY